MSQTRYCPPTNCKNCKKNVPTTILHEAELFVESGSILNRKWKRVLCRFDGEHMVYYETAISSTETNVNSSAPRKLVDYLHISDAQAKAKTHEDHPPPHAPFVVTTSSKTLTFVALSADDRTTWIKQIQSGAQNSQSTEQYVAPPVASSSKTTSSNTLPPLTVAATATQPQTPEEFREEYSRHSHFHGAFKSREDAEAHLGSRPPGSFVLRPSSQAGCISLSFCKPHKAIGHSLLRMHHDAQRIGWSVDDKNTYPTLDALLMTLTVDLNSKP